MTLNDRDRGRDGRGLLRNGSIFLVECEGILTFDQGAGDGPVGHAELQAMALHEGDSRVVQHAKKFDRSVGTVAWQFIHDLELGLVQTLARAFHCNNAFTR